MTNQIRFAKSWVISRWIVLSSVIFLAVYILGPGFGVAKDKGYTFETIDPPGLTPGVDSNVQVVFINNAGLITVQYQQPIAAWWDNVHAAFVQGGHWTTLEVQGYANAYGTANSQGEIAMGYWGQGDYAFKTMIYWRGHYTPLEFRDMGPDRYVVIDAMNDREQFAAAVFDGEDNAYNMVGHGLVGTSSKYTIFDYPAAVNTIAMGINNAETVVGWYVDSEYKYHAFLYDPQRNAFTNIDVPDATSSFASWINNSGEIAGTYLDQNENGKGFLLRGSQYTDFIVPGAVFTQPYCINDRGQVSGTYMDSNGAWHGFVATPMHGK
jgi:probable HAF family extracellular repeat protein